MASMTQAFDPGKVMIVIGSGASKTERFAARELANEISSRVSVRPSVVSESRLNERSAAGKLLFILGTNQSSKLAASLIADGKCKAVSEMQGYALRTIPNPVARTGAAIVVAGGAARGVLYGVRDLQHYYLMDDGKRILASPLDLTSAPKVEFRALELWDFYAADPFAYVDQMSRWKLNAFLICPWRYVFEHHGIIDYARERGVDIILGDGPYSYHYVGFGNHNQWAILPREAPPEIKRSPDGSCLCPSAPGTIPWMTQYMTGAIEKLPGLSGVYLQTGNLDGHECRCQECGRYAAGEYFAMEINPLIAAIAERFPNLPIGYGLGHRMVRTPEYMEWVPKVDKRGTLWLENRYPMPNREDMDLLDQLLPGNYGLVAKLYGSRGQILGWRERRTAMFAELFDSAGEAARRGVRGIMALVQTRLYHRRSLYVVNMYSEALWHGGAPPKLHQQKLRERSDLDQRVSDPPQQVAQEGAFTWLIKYPEATMAERWVPWPTRAGTQNISDLLSGEESATYRFRMPRGWWKGLRSAQLVIQGAKDDVEGVKSEYRFDIGVNGHVMRNLKCPWNKGGDVRNGRYGNVSEWRMEIPRKWLDDRSEVTLRFRDADGMVMYDRIAFGLEYGTGARTRGA